MAKMSILTRTMVLSTQPPFKLPKFNHFINIVFHSFILPFTYTLPITPSNTENYLPSDDPNITNLMVSHYDCEKQHYLRQLNLSNVKQCTEAQPSIRHASVKARVYVRAKAKRIKTSNCAAYAKKERKNCFQGSVKYYVTSCYT